MRLDSAFGRLPPGSSLAEAATVVVEEGLGPTGGLALGFAVALGRMDVEALKMSTHYSLSYNRASCNAFRA